MNASPDAAAFNLVDQPWIAVRDAEGGMRTLSLEEVLGQAHELVGLAGDVPTQDFALTRLLLGVLHGALRGPATVEEWEALWRADRLPMDVVTPYLAAHRERFDLFHPSTPFMQVAALHTAKGEMVELSKLIADVPNGHRFFSTRLGPDLSLSYAEAARWVVHCQAFDPSGIKSGAVGDQRVKDGKGYGIGVGWSGLLGGVLPEGHTLRETLLLNLTPTEFVGRDPARDRPTWEHEPLTAAEQPADRLTPAGPVTLFTWQSRRIRLHAERGRVVAVLVCNGDKLTPQNMHPVETHTSWRRSPNQEKAHKSSIPIYMPLEHRAERVVWRGLASMLPDVAGEQGQEAASRLTSTVSRWLAHLTTDGVIERTYPVRMRTIGMTYGSNSSVTEEVIDDALSIQAVLLAQDAAALKGAAVACVEASEAAARALGTLAGDLARAAGGDPSGYRDRAVESAYATLDPLFRSWLAHLGPDNDAFDCQVDWHQQANNMILGLGDDLVAGTSPTSWVGRVHSGRFYSTAHADSWFRKQLRTVLPHAYPRPSESVPA